MRPIEKRRLLRIHSILTPLPRTVESRLHLQGRFYHQNAFAQSGSLICVLLQNNWEAKIPCSGRLREVSHSEKRRKRGQNWPFPSHGVSSEFRTSRTYTDNLPILLSRARLETVNAVCVFSEWETSKGTVTSLSLKIVYGCSYHVKKY